MIDAAKNEPMPEGGVQKVAPFVFSQMLKRVSMGKEKYGTYLKTFDGRDTLMDAFQEAIDLCMYLGKEIMEREDGPSNSG